MFKVGDRVKQRHWSDDYWCIVESVNEDANLCTLREIRTGAKGDWYPMVSSGVSWEVATPRWYIAGPMRGIPDFNFPAFNAAAEKLRAEGLYVFNPAETNHESIKLNADGDESKSEGFCRRTALAIDLNWIARHATGVAFLPGWENSSGARAEHALAVALDLKMRYL